MIYGSKVSVCKQIGNAVPPLLALAIANKIDSEYNRKTLYSDNYCLINADAISYSKELLKQQKYFDHIITDPPYNISQKNNFSTLKNPRFGINFGSWDRNFNVLSWIGDYAKLLKQDGSFIVFCSYRFISYLISEMEKNDLIVKDVIIWKKTNPMPRNTNRRYVQDMEFAVWAIKKNAKWTFNKEKSIPYLRSVFQTSLVSGSERVGHPTQKSLSLMKQIIKIHTNKNDLILDPFMGSGTTGIAALSCNRRFFLVLKLIKNFIQ